RALDELAPLLEEPEAGTQHGFRRRRPEADEDLGPDHVELLEEPRPARLHLAARRRLVDAPLGRSLELEVLDRVGHEDVPASDLRSRERLVQQRSGRADERMALPVLLVARLLADEDEPGAGRALAEHGLRRVAIEVAAAALLNRAGQIREVTGRR